MLGFKGSNYRLNIFSSGKVTSPRARYVYWFGAFALLMAVLAFSQDYISAVLHGNYFDVGESLSYKLFWLIFVPSLIALFYLLEQARSRFSHATYLISNALLVLVLTLAHLLLFSFLLYITLNTISDNYWSFTFLITEKLSSRLYIGLAVYIVSSVIYLWLYNSGQQQQSERKEIAQTIKVKNGRSTTLVDISDISWISSDGAYLNIHTANKKHIILDSLKNIITTLPDNFKRIHRSTIVNIDRVSELQSRGNGDYDIEMDNGATLRLSRNYTKPLKGLLL